MLKRYIYIILLLISCNSQEDDSIEDTQEILYNSIIDLCSDNNCPDEVVCFYSNEDYFLAVYVYNDEYYELAWSVSRGENVHNDFPLKDFNINNCPN